MTRVIAGEAGGRRLRVPDGKSVRPTSDRVKEALFSSLGDLRGAVVLDLFAGSGGLGIEALSRGAERAVFVEKDKRTVTVIRENLRAAGVEDRSRVVPSAAKSFVNMPTGGPFDLVLLDPPYDMAMEEITGALMLLVGAEALRTGARVVIERDKRSSDRAPSFLSHDHDRTYGETVLRYFTFNPDGPDQVTS